MFAFCVTMGVILILAILGLALLVALDGYYTKKAYKTDKMDPEV